MSSLLEIPTIKEFLKKVGYDIEKYFGKDKGCIIYLRPDGAFYGIALYERLKAKKKNITLTTMEDDGNGLEEEKVKGRKVLVVDNDIVTGTAYKRAMEAMRLKKQDLCIKEIKFATYIDRVGLSDFFVWKYSPEGIWHLGELDAIDLKIIADLSRDGRVSFVELAKKTKLSPVAIKNRVDHLLQNKILRIQGSLNIDRFYTMSAQINIEADGKTVENLIEKFAKLQYIYHLLKTSGRYNLILGLLAHNIENIEGFIENELRSVPGVKQINILIGELPLLPKTVPPHI